MIQPSLIGNQTRFAAGIGVLLSLLGAVRGQQPAASPLAVAPVRGYLSVEAFELRKEFVLDFDAVAERVGAAGVTTIDATNRASWEKAIGDWLVPLCPVSVDGRPLAMDLDRVHFVRPDVEKGLVVEDRESVPAAEALVGVVFAAALDGPPGEVRVRWEVFPPDGSEAVVEAGVRAQRTARKLSAADPELVWKNEAGLTAPALLAVPEAPVRTWGDVIGSVPGGVAMGVFLAGMVPLLLGRRRLAAVTVTVGLIVGGSLLAWGWQRDSRIVVSAEQADEICYALLRNVYHAFDYRRESDIYDTLARSATGDLLTRIYLEIQRSLQVETQGGARVRVTDVDLRRCEPGGSMVGGFEAECEWVAVGTVTHWGHTHDRVNRYRARLSVAPVAGKWRLVGLELVSEERI